MENIIDSHVHIDMMAEYSPDSLQYYKKNNIIAVSWSFWKNIKFTDQLFSYLKYQETSVNSIAHTLDSQCYYLTGIHPRNIPKDFKVNGKILDVLLFNLSSKKCLGIGEIGLEEATAIEIEVLKIQLNMVSEIKNKTFKIGIHTPRNNKREITLELFNILRKYPHLTDRILIDHCNINTISMVLERGYTAGITLSPSKTEINELLSIVHKCKNKVSKIMCNSDNGGSASKYFFDVAESKNILDDNLKAKLFFKNAADFFQINQNSSSMNSFNVKL